MTRRRTRTKPSAGMDWRALAAPPDQRRLALPVAVDGDDAGDVDLTVRTDPDGRTRAVLIASVTWTDAAELRAFGDRVHASADEIEKADRTADDTDAAA